MVAKVRVRFPPSPTGDPHVGNIRTAIFNWLLARHCGGSFLLRIEDTDQARKVDGATESLLDSLRWLGLDWDEGPDVGGDYGPYYQSQRLDLYHQVTQGLLESGKAYRCYCSPQRLSDVRKEQSKLKNHPGYDRKCRDFVQNDPPKLDGGDIGHVVRFKMPMNGVTSVDDLVRGPVSFENHLIDDFVILKSDGFPTYHLANVVDDHFMEISHVLRGEEWLPSTPRHIQLYQGLGWNPPQFAHLPMILAADKSKLSKRHGAISILAYRKMGYLPQAMVNFLALLGWSLDDKTELISTEELTKHFDLGRVGVSGAVFSSDKLDWMNGSYIRQASHECLADMLLDYWRRYPPDGFPDLPEASYLLRIVPLIQERLKTLGDAAPLTTFFFTDSISYDSSDLIQKGMESGDTKKILESALIGLSNISSFDSEPIEKMLRNLAQEMNIKPRLFLGSLRVAVTGLRVAPPMFQTIEVIGKERTLAFIRRAIDRL